MTARVSAAAKQDGVVCVDVPARYVTASSFGGRDGLSVHLQMSQAQAVELRDALNSFSVLPAGSPSSSQGAAGGEAA